MGAVSGGVGGRPPALGMLDPQNAASQTCDTVEGPLTGQSDLVNLVMEPLHVALKSIHLQGDVVDGIVLLLDAREDRVHPYVRFLKADCHLVRKHLEASSDISQAPFHTIEPTVNLVEPPQHRASELVFRHAAQHSSKNPLPLRMTRKPQRTLNGDQP